MQLPKLKVFYHLDGSIIQAQDEQFAGRVQCDKEALTAGRVRLHLARVRTEDSAGYLCKMATGYGRKVKEFALNITRKFLHILFFNSYNVCTSQRDLSLYSKLLKKSFYFNFGLHFKKCG